MIVKRGIPSRLEVTSDMDSVKLYELVGLNTGNLLFNYAVSKMLFFPREKGWTVPFEKGEIAIYPMANQLGVYFNPSALANFLTSSPDDIKILFIALGSQIYYGEDPETLLKMLEEKGYLEQHLRILKRVREKCPNPDKPNITLRGFVTLEVFKKLFKNDYKHYVIVTGCPSNLISSKLDLGKEIWQKFQAISKYPFIVGVLGDPCFPERSKFEKRLFNLVYESDGFMIVQMYLEYYKLARGERLSEHEVNKIYKELCWDKKLNLYDFLNLLKRKLKIFFDVPAWLETLKSVDFVLSTRVHGTIAALQSGTPALCVTVDYRTQELCEFMSIPYVKIDEEPWQSGSFTWQDIKKTFEEKFDPVRYDNIRKKQAQLFIDFFTWHNISFDVYLKEIAFKR